MPDPSLSLALFGRFEARYEDEPLTQFATDKIRALLAYLAIEADKPHRRETLATLFWPDFSDEIALRNLRQSLYRLRQTLQRADPTLPENLITQNRRTVTLHSAWISLDVARFDEAIREARASARPIRHLSLIPDLYRGELLLGLTIDDAYAFDEWLTIQREVFQQQAVDALARLLGLHEADQDTESILAVAPKLLALEPWHEETHRRLMQAHLQKGNRTRAIAQYQELRKLMLEELGVDPSPATTALFSQIKDNASTPPDVSSGRHPSRGSGFPRAAHRNPLPAAMSSLVGRQRELADLVETLQYPACRLLTITGPGGIGKTRLCIEAAHHLAAAPGCFPDGSVFVPLAQVEDGAGLASAVVQAAGLEIRAQSDPQKELVRHLQGQELLLILDNFEHFLVETGSGLLPPAVAFVVDLLNSVPAVTLLVTSRDPLAIQPEWIVPLEGLSYSGPGDVQRVDLLDEPAPQLFIQNARRYNASFNPAENADAILEVCRLTDGLPLAIEMAATWLRVYTCAEIARSISESLDLLVSPFRDAPGRQRSIRVILDSTWKQLTPEQQETLKALSVFRGGFSIQAALFVTEAHILDLSILVDKSLLRRTSDHRYYLHELVGQFSRDKLETAGGSDPIRERHAHFYLADMSEQGRVLNGPNPLDGLAQIRQNLDNLRAAWDWAATRARLPLLEMGIHGLAQFWVVTGANREGEAGIQKAIAAIGAIPQDSEAASVQSELASSLAWLQMGLGKNEEAEEYIRSALAFAEKAGNADRRATALSLQGWLLQNQGHFDEAEKVLGDACEIFEQTGNLLEWSLALIRTGSVFWWRSMVDRSLIYYQRSLQIEQAIGNKRGISRAYGALGLAYVHLEKYEQALEYLEKALQSDREMGSQPGIVRNLGHLGNIQLNRGEYPQAAAYYLEALDIEQKSGSKNTSAIWLGNLGRVHTRLNDHSQALAYYEQSIALAHETGSRHQLCEVMLGKAGVFILQNRLEEAQPLVDEALTISYEIDRKDTKLRGMILKARLLAKSGQPEQARALLESSRETLATEYKELETRARLVYELWKIDNSLEDARAAAALYEECLRRVEKIEYTERIQEIKAFLHRQA